MAQNWPEQVLQGGDRSRAGPYRCCLRSPGSVEGNLAYHGPWTLAFHTPLVRARGTPHTPLLPAAPQPPWVPGCANAPRAPAYLQFHYKPSIFQQKLSFSIENHGFSPGCSNSATRERPSISAGVSSPANPSQVGAKSTCDPTFSL